MRFTTLFLIAIKNILKNKMRSFLTSLGIIIGVSSVTIMVGIGQGSQVGIEKQIASLGTNLIMVFAGSNRYRGISQGSSSLNRLSLTDLDTLKKELSDIEYITPVVQMNAQLIGGSYNWLSTVYGVSPDYQFIKSYTLSSGNFFTESDTKSARNFAVIGKTVSEELFPDMDPVGQSIRIGKVPFKVIGLLESKGKSSMGMDQDDIVIVPYKTFLNRLSSSRYIRSIQIQVKSASLLDETKQKVKEILRNNHKLSSNQEDDFTIGTQEEIAEKAKSVSQIMTLLLGSIAAVSLIVGGIGIMNIMLVSVTERTREIGIRIAVGAKSFDIMAQFLIESLVLSGIGGVIGIVVSVITAVILNSLSGLTVVININLMVISLLFSAGVGIFFGFYPAKKASTLNPIEALRYE